MKEAVCRYCGKKIESIGGDWYYRRRLDEPSGYLCSARGGSEDLSHLPEYQHEPITKEDKVLEILRTYENTIRSANKH